MRGLFYLLFALLFCILVENSFATNINRQEIQLGSGIQYNLTPNNPQLISNQYLWTVNAICVIQSETDDNFLAFKVTKKQGTLNDELLVAGDARTIRLKYKEKVNISAKSGAEVELLNVGKDLIVTECTFSF